MPPCRRSPVRVKNLASLPPDREANPYLPANALAYAVAGRDERAKYHYVNPGCHPAGGRPKGEKPGVLTPKRTGLIKTRVQI